MIIPQFMRYDFLKAQITKCNIFKEIPGLHMASQQLAGRSCYLDAEQGLTYCDPKGLPRPAGIYGFFLIGRQMMHSGKFPLLTRINFPDKASSVRKFIRLIIRTETRLSDASSATGVAFEDFSRYHPRPLLAPVK